MLCAEEIDKTGKQIYVHICISDVTNPDFLNRTELYTYVKMISNFALWTLKLNGRFTIIVNLIKRILKFV